MMQLLALLLSAAPAWPADLTTGWTAVSVTRVTPGQPRLTVKLEPLRDGTWKVLAPWRGEGDLLAVGRLKLALEAPQLVTAALEPSPASLEIVLQQGKRVRRVTTHVAALNAPIRVTVDGKSFAVSPVELGIKLPAPEDFAPAGLWLAARDEASSIEVKGPQRYKLTGKGKAWKVGDGRAPTRDLASVIGVVVGRQAIDHPSGSDLAALGLAPPQATATLCTPRECRDFKFGSANGRYYALAPDADPIELRDTDWKQLVVGPFSP